MCINTHILCDHEVIRGKPAYHWCPLQFFSSFLIFGSVSWLDHRTNSLIELRMSSIIPRCESPLSMQVWERLFLSMCVLYYPVHCTKRFLICLTENVMDCNLRVTLTLTPSLIFSSPFIPASWTTDISFRYLQCSYTQYTDEKVQADRQCCPCDELLHVDRFHRNINWLTARK